VVASGIDRATEPPLTSAQRRNLKGAREAMGDAADVRAFAAGRANARWSTGARWVLGIFIAVFAGAFVLLHVILIPGGLVVYVLYDTVKPRRGVAVTPAGVAELKLSMMNGRPSSVLAMTNHAALIESALEDMKSKGGVRFGGEDVSLRGSDLRMLRSAIPVPVPPARPDAGASLPLPPPPPLVGRVADPPLPRWREATLLWVLANAGVV
jgi:hypothetical protein